MDAATLTAAAVFLTSLGSFAGYMASRPKTDAEAEKTRGDNLKSFATEWKDLFKQEREDRLAAKAEAQAVTAVLKATETRLDEEITKRRASEDLVEEKDVVITDLKAQLEILRWEGPK